MLKRIFIVIFALMMAISFESCVSCSGNGGGNSTNNGDGNSTNYYDAGYKSGYEYGFRGYTGPPASYAPTCYSASYGAPASDAEKQQYNKYLNGFVDGFKKAKNDK